MILFGIIYTVDCHGTRNLRQFEPTSRRAWRITEYAPDGTYDEYWGRDYKHRKYVAVLTRDQFEEFVDDACLVASTVQTLGSLGAPTPGGGCSLGILPAVSFDYRSDEYELNAYVTPYVVRASREKRESQEWEPVRAEGMNDRDWDRLRDGILALYSDHPRFRSQLARLREARLAGAASLEGGG